MIANSNGLKLSFFTVTLLITLMFGLYPKDFGPGHVPALNADGDLAFTRYSLASTELDLTGLAQSSTIQSDPGQALAFDVTLAIPQMPDIQTRFTTLFSINDAFGGNKILLGQWKDYLIVMAGDDYPNEAELPRITVSLSSISHYQYPQALQVRLSATQVATTLVINGEPVAMSREFIVSLQPEHYRVSLGNTLDRKQGWTGSLAAFELSVYDADINTTRLSLEPGTGAPWVLHSAFSVLDTEWLSLESLQEGFWSTFKRDVIINFIGFIPVSFSLFLLAATRFRPATSALQTVAGSALISLIIESAQVFIPSRTSSMVDLAVNSAAGALTALCCYLVVRWLRRKPLPTPTD